MTTPDINLPGSVHVRTPVSRITAPAPTSTVHIVPTAGPRGLPGADGAATDIGVVAEMIQEHVVDPEPHPAYDDIPSLVLLFENRLV